MTTLRALREPPYDHEADLPMFPCGICGAGPGELCHPEPHLEGLRPAAGIFCGVIIGVGIGFFVALAIMAWIVL